MYSLLKEILFLIFYCLPFSISVEESEVSEYSKRLLVDSQQLVQSQIDSLHKTVQALQQQVNQQALQLQVNQDRSNSRQTGSVYTIWGRKSCPTVNGTELVYSGFTGGGQYNEKGGGVNALCLPHDPDSTPSDFPSRLEGSGMVGHIYGSEYQFTYRNIAIEDDVPCAVCRSSISSSVLMIPAKVKCAHGWMKQFSGILSSNYYSYAKSDYICVDENPEYFDGTRRNNDNGFLLYPVQALCGSLPCPPYKHMQYVSCVVCTK